MRDLGVGIARQVNQWDVEGVLMGVATCWAAFLAMWGFRFNMVQGSDLEFNVIRLGLFGTTKQQRDLLANMLRHERDGNGEPRFDGRGLAQLLG